MWLRRPRSSGPPRAFRKLRTLSRGDWAVLTAATILLPVAAVAVRIVELRRLLALIDALTVSDHRRANPLDAARIARLVEAAAACGWPRPACLTKALVALALFKRRGLGVELVIGVTRAGGSFEAHAWVRHGDDILIGGGASAVHAPLVSVADRRNLVGGAGRSGCRR